VTRRGLFQPAARLPIRWSSVGAVAAGGFLGGLGRYAVVSAWPSGPATFPWGVFAVNTSGAFLLALLLSLAFEVLPPALLLRPFAGTGFCGAYTTFASVATAVDLFVAHGRAGLALVYLFGSLFAGLAAAASGLILGRVAAVAKERGLR
jgi:CrcB protein